MNRRTLIKTSSLFAVTSIFSASISAIRSRSVNAQIIVSPNNSSCARGIYGVFQQHQLNVRFFDIVYRDGRGRSYRYSSATSSRLPVVRKGEVAMNKGESKGSSFTGIINAAKSIKKIDTQPDLSLASISSDAHPSFDTSRSTIAQDNSLANRVLSSIQGVMHSEGVSLISAKVDAVGPNGPCQINVVDGSSCSYC